jgi:hypothetical protein
MKTNYINLNNNKKKIFKLIIIIKLKKKPATREKTSNLIFNYVNKI